MLDSKASKVPEIKDIKVIIGLGNPGSRFEDTRHNIGFSILDELAQQYNANWSTKQNMEIANITVDNKNIELIKPQTFMNNSGQISPYLQKRGIKPEQILVVHDELEKPLGSVSLKLGGSSRGHNGLKSIMAHIGADFWRLRVGIDRPVNKEDVPDYVLGKFKDYNQVEEIKHKAIKEIENILK